MVKRIETVTVDFFVGRRGDETAWDIPLEAPLHHWVVPIAVMEGEHTRRVGSAFHFSRLGHLFSARHCVDEALHPSDRGILLGERARHVQINSDLIVLRATDDERSEVTGFPVQTVTGPEPTDLVCLTTLFQERIPQLTVPLSFALPEAGSTVRCFGYPQDAGEKLFPDSLRVVEGVVKAYFPPGFTRGFMRGPCFLVGASVPNGMSGGPVMNEAGAVCGIVSAGAELFLNEAACLVTPLYPSIFLHVAIHAQLASNFRINATRSLIDLCAEGFVTTDGTEDRVHFVEDDEGIEIGPIISMPNGAHVYNSYDDYSRGVSSTPLTEPRMRITVDRAQDGATER